VDKCAAISAFVAFDHADDVRTIHGGKLFLLSELAGNMPDRADQRGLP
jgi:hypothetical protein